MGHLINPVTNRLSLNIFWNNKWSLNLLKNYNKLFKKNIYFFKFLSWFFQKKIHIKNKLIFSHYRLYLNSQKEIYINIYYFWESFKDKKSKSYFKKIIQYCSYRKYKYKYTKLLKKFQKLIHYKILYFYLYLINLNWKYFINIFKLNTLNIIKLKFINLKFTNINGNVILKYIRMRLISKYSLNYTLKPILRDLYLRMRSKKILGYRILCAGRFTRRQIAIRSWYKQGPSSVNNFSNLIKYNQMKVRLKYGVCGIKIWVNYGKISLFKVTQRLYLEFPVFQFLNYKIDLKKKIKFFFFFNYSTFLWNNVYFFKKIFFNYYKVYFKIKIYIKFYTLLIKNFLKENKIILKKKKFKQLLILPFVILGIKTSKELCLNINYNLIFSLNNKFYIYN